VTTLHPTVPEPADIEPGKEPYANKAIAAAGTAIAGFVTQWLSTGSIEFDQEGITAIIGGVATVLVYFISNRKRKGV